MRRAALTGSGHESESPKGDIYIPILYIYKASEQSITKEKKRESEMELKLYVDRVSQPSRAILIFCKINGIEFEEVKIDLMKGKHLAPEFEEINPMKQVPAIVHGDLKLSESHAILRYLASAFPVADHWYPNDVKKRAKVESLLDWHHTNLRFGSVELVRNTVLAPALGMPPNLEAASKGEKVLCASLEKIEALWLNESGPFLLGNAQPSIADLVFVCEIMQIEFLGDEVHDRILGPCEKVKHWKEATKVATSPYFDEMHEAVFAVKEMFKKKQAESGAK